MKVKSKAASNSNCDSQGLEPLLGLDGKKRQILPSRFLFGTKNRRSREHDKLPLSLHRLIPGRSSNVRLPNTVLIDERSNWKYLVTYGTHPVCQPTLWLGKQA